METKKRVYNKPAIIQCLPDTAECRRLLDMLDIKDEPDNAASDQGEESKEATE